MVVLSYSHVEYVIMVPYALVEQYISEKSNASQKILISNMLVKHCFREKLVLGTYKTLLFLFILLIRGLYVNSIFNG